jgi:hypothetical protein
MDLCVDKMPEKHFISSIRNVKIFFKIQNNLIIIKSGVSGYVI